MKLEIQQKPAVRLGLVGFGKLARDYYVPALGGLRSALVAAVADPLPASCLVARSACPKAEIFTNFRAMLTSAQLDAVIVASPPSTHFDAWLAASRRDLPVLMEKPFLFPDDLESAAADRERRPLLMINFNRRFWPVYQSVRRVRQERAIGQIRCVNLDFEVRVLDWCTVTNHRLSPVEGGPLYDLGSHALDLLAFILGEQPSRICASAWSRVWEADHVRLRLELPSGVGAVCTLGYGARNRERLDIRGSGGRVTVTNPNMLPHFAASNPLARLAQRTSDCLALGYRGFRRSRSLLRYTTRVALETFVDSLSRNKPFSPGFEDALANARCLAAAVNSLASGRTVALPDGRASLADEQDFVSRCDELRETREDTP